MCWTPAIFDLDVHEIPARKVRIPAHYHYDVRFVFQAAARGLRGESEESLDLAWVEIADLRAFTQEVSMLPNGRKVA